MEFKKFHDDEKCGWDPSSKIPWKSLQLWQSDTIKTIVTPADNADRVRFESSDTNKVIVSPAKISSVSPILTIAGISSGEAEIKAICDGSMLGSFQVKVYSFNLPIVIAESDRKPRKNADGTEADDIKCGDYTEESIRNIRLTFAEASLDLETVSTKTLFSKFRKMASTFFATGDLEENINAMIDKFESNSGGEYSNPILTRAVREHDSTKKFEQQIRNKLSMELNKYRGDMNKLEKSICLYERPAFNTIKDYPCGLKIAINDTWAYEVKIIEYNLSDRCYKGKFSLILYDHFGLDEPDIKDKFPGVLPGFIAWFILQHLDRFSYQPFVTKIELEYSFEGRLN